MKFYETHFEEYIQSNKRENLHPKLEKILSKFPKNIGELKNVIFYGPSGVGKYTQTLNIIKKYSSTDLKYEKKISVTFNKQQYFFKISDIHYEIDMSLLGCNSKLLWHDIFQQIIDIISAKTNKSGIIVCKYFHEIHSELLDNFYSYMQQSNNSIDLKFFIISEEISFIPDNILNCCEIINIPRPTKTAYNKCLKNKLDNKLKVENITNIKNLYNGSTNTEQIMHNYKTICDKILNVIYNSEDIKFLKFRDILYDILIYNLNVNECIWYILNDLIMNNKIKKEYFSEIMVKTYRFFQYYNNNYRPIYHLENYFFYLINNVNSK